MKLSDIFSLEGVLCKHTVAEEKREMETLRADTEEGKMPNAKKKSKYKETPLVQALEAAKTKKKKAMKTKKNPGRRSGDEGEGGEEWEQEAW